MILYMHTELQIHSKEALYAYFKQLMLIFEENRSRKSDNLEPLLFTRQSLFIHFSSNRLPTIGQLHCSVCSLLSIAHELSCEAQGAFECHNSE